EHVPAAGDLPGGDQTQRFGATQTATHGRIALAHGRHDLDAREWRVLADVRNQLPVDSRQRELALHGERSALQDQILQRYELGYHEMMTRMRRRGMPTRREAWREEGQGDFARARMRQLAAHGSA